MLHSNTCFPNNHWYQIAKERGVEKFDTYLEGQTGHFQISSEITMRTNSKFSDHSTAFKQPKI